MISIIVLGLVFILIAVRQIGNIRFQIWQVMVGGALAVLITGQITPLDAMKAINLDVMLFLFGVFVVGQAMESSGYLAHLSYGFFRRARSVDSLVLYILFGIGSLSALLMNDTLAIIGTPLVLSLARKARVESKVLLLALAFAITIGSAMSPIGNPQNLLVAVNGNITNPFITFFRYLLLPTIVNLFLAYLMLRLFYRRQFHGEVVNHVPEPVTDPALARLSRVSLIIMGGLVLIKIAIVFAGWDIDFRLTYIALAAALPVVLLSPRRLEVVRRIDWFTLIFFAAMFVLMASVWNAGIFQGIIGSSPLDLTSTGMILAVSILLSQLVSNVPLAALYLPMLMQLGASTRGLAGLAAGSTIAGNLTVLGAASNVIIIQNAEKRAGETLTFWDFLRIGVPLTLANALVYWLFLSFI
jgi:Na+/H+ antiporter NhaD/arsenite permease-like protein